MSADISIRDVIYFWQRKSREKKKSGQSVNSVYSYTHIHSNVTNRDDIHDWYQRQTWQLVTVRTGDFK